MKRKQELNKLKSMPNGWLIEQVKAYGEYMPRARTKLCILALRQKGAINHQCASQAVDLYAKGN